MSLKHLTPLDREYYEQVCHANSDATTPEAMVGELTVAGRMWVELHNACANLAQSMFYDSYPEQRPVGFRLDELWRRGFVIHPSLPASSPEPFQSEAEIETANAPTSEVEIEPEPPASAPPQLEYWLELTAPSGKAHPGDVIVITGTARNIDPAVAVEYAWVFEREILPEKSNVCTIDTKGWQPGAYRVGGWVSQRGFYFATECRFELTESAPAN